MEVCVLARSGDAEGAMFALSLARGTAVGLAPMSKKGDRLVKKVHWMPFEVEIRKVGAAVRESVQTTNEAERCIRRGDLRGLRLGLPGLLSATREGADYIDHHEPMRVVLAKGNDVKEATLEMAAVRTVEEIIGQCRLIVIFGGDDDVIAAARFVQRALDEEYKKDTPSTHIHIISTLVVVFHPAGFMFKGGLESMFKDLVASKNVLLLQGASTISAVFHGDAVVPSSCGSLVLSRMARGALDCKLHLQALEGCTLPVAYRGSANLTNWSFGVMIWRLFDAYAASVFSESEANKIVSSSDVPALSMYEQLGVCGIRHRLVFHKLIEEALSTISTDEMLLADPVGSPLGIGFQAALQLLRLPDPFFYPLLQLTVLVSGTGRVAQVRASPHGSLRSLELAPLLHRFVFERAKEANITVPANEMLLRRATSARPCAPWTEQDFAQLELRSPLTHHYGLLAVTMVLLLTSAIIAAPFVLYKLLMIAVFGKFDVVILS